MFLELKQKACKMDVLLFIPTGGGGAEKVSLNIAKILNRSGKNVHVVFIEGANKNVMSYICPDITYEIIPASGHFKRYMAILKSIRENEPKVVFSSLTALSTILIIAKIFNRNIKVVTRQCFTPKHGRKTINFIIRLLFRFADVNISQTEEMRDQMLTIYKLPPKKVVTVHNPLDTEDIDSKVVNVKKAHVGGHRFIAIGRLDYAKDYPTLIRAFSIVKKQLPDATLKIYGHTDNRRLFDEITGLITMMDLANSISINHYTDNPYKELIESNCFVLTSVTEGLPNVLLEAMYLNLPCAATRSIPFIAETIIDGENGFTANVGDPEDVAIAMIKSVSLYGKINNKNAQDGDHSLIINIFS